MEGEIVEELKTTLGSRLFALLVTRSYHPVYNIAYYERIVVLRCERLN